jgi:mRNA-degrading endonuclease YafQ of YafQ-DinJ toxin-antitoxin module
MHIEATETFIKLFHSIPTDIRERAKKVLELLSIDSSHPSLGHKKLAGQSDLYELHVSQNCRITYQKVGDTAYLLKIGTHDLLRRP